MKKLVLQTVMIFFILSLFSQTLNWISAQSFGSIGVDNCKSDIDWNGNQYFVGSFSNSITFGDTTLTSLGSTDIFIAKMDQDSNWLWAKRAGGTGPDFVNDIYVYYETFYFGGAFSNNAGFGNTQLESSGLTDIFVASMDFDGNWLYAVKAGGPGADACIALSDGGQYYSPYVTGYFSLTANFDDMTVTSAGNKDIFVAAMSWSLPDVWYWVERAGGSGEDCGNSIHSTGNGHIGFTGYFENSADFGTYQLTSNGNKDMFAAIVNYYNGYWLEAYSAGGPGNDIGIDLFITMDMDSFPTMYVTGQFESTAVFGNMQLTSMGLSDIFVSYIDHGQGWQWTTQAGGSGQDYPSVMSFGGYIAGTFSSTATFGSYSLQDSSTSGDIFLARISNSGNWLMAVGAGGSGYDNCNSIVFIMNPYPSYIYLSGTFENSAFFGPFQLTSLGASDIFNAVLYNGVVSNNDSLHPPSSLLAVNCYPNPFQNELVIKYESKVNSPVQVSIFNVKGELIKTFTHANSITGNHTIIWYGTDKNQAKLPSGIYYIRLSDEKAVALNKVVLIR